MINHIKNHIFNHIYRIFVAVAITSLVAGCSEDDILSDKLISDAPGTITLRFKNSEMTRSTDSENSEVKIDNLVIGLYPTGYEETSAPVFWDKFENLNASSKTTLTLQLTKGMIQDLFRGEDGAKCRLFALANVPVTDLQNLPVPSTIKQMKSLAVESPFYEEMVQESFIMYGDSVVVYKEPESSGALGKASGNINLIRAASKIILNLNLPTIEIKDENGNVVETWEAVEDGSKIMATLNNGVKKSIACPLAGEDNQPWKPTDPDAYYSGNLGVDGSFRTFVENSSSDSNYPYTMQVPFYTYPNSWSETLTETHKTTITLCVPWKRVGSDDYQTFYYQVPVTKSDITSISNNHAYTIKLTVGMLGSREPDKPELLTDMSYSIVDWGKEDLSVEIDDIRYLVVNPTEYVVNNEEEFSIPFYTSHPVEVCDYSITYPQFNVYGPNATEKRGLPVDIEMDSTVINKSVYNHDGVTDTIATFHIEQDPQTNQMILKVHHELVMWNPRKSSGGTISMVRQINNNTTPADSLNNLIAKYVRPSNPDIAYYPYTIKVTIRHKDVGYRDTYKETVTITQYPGMYITVDRNPGGEYWTNVGSDRPWAFPNSREFEKHGYAFVNPYEEEFGGKNGLPGGICWMDDRSLGGLLAYIDNGALNSPCMYIIHVTQFDPSMSDQYVIGNPRSKLVNNMNYTGLSDEELEEDLDIQDSAPADKWILKKIGVSVETDEIEGWCRAADALYPNNSSTQRTLEYYYPTIESDETKNMVAPLYRFASSYGGLNRPENLASPNTRKIGRRRIATYQERQFASGRWRLPTYGEFRLIAWLSATDRIPSLFNNDQPYLTAHGVYLVKTPSGELVESTGGIPRCNARGVYDDWYWNEEKEYVLQSEEDGSYRYTLGDMPQKTIQSNN